MGSMDYGYYNGNNNMFDTNALYIGIVLIVCVAAIGLCISWNWYMDRKEIAKTTTYFGLRG